MIQITLPWPDKRLNPNNARGHWAKRSGPIKQARSDAAWLAKAAIGPKPDWPGAKVSMTFCPPDKRRRDRDNLIASMKAATDGIADALGIDDSKFETTYAISTPIKGGAVTVTIEEMK